MSDGVRTLNAVQIMELLPHRYPFLLIDKVIDCVPNKSVTAIKNVSINEPFFHRDLEPRPLYYLVGVDGARFRRPVGPGDQLRIHIEIDKVRRGMWWYRCEASVEGQTAVTAKILCAPGEARS